MIIQDLGDNEIQEQMKLFTWIFVAFKIFIVLKIYISWLSWAFEYWKKNIWKTMENNSDACWVNNRWLNRWPNLDQISRSFIEYLLLQRGELSCWCAHCTKHSKFSVCFAFLMLTVSHNTLINILGNFFNVIYS